MSGSKYNVIYADPPWYFREGIPSVKGSNYTNTKLEDHYPTMRNNELEEFFTETVSGIAADDCVLIMWTTDAHLDFAIRLGTLAGFTYKTVAFVWNKKTPRGNQVCYMVKWTMKGTEIALLFTKGRAHKLLRARNVRQLVEAERREHSRKPDEVAERIEQMFPDSSKIELFARTQRPGWDSHGNEVDKF